MADQTETATEIPQEPEVRTEEKPIEVTLLNDSMTETIGDLALALSKAQGKIQNVGKDKQGYGYKYAAIDSIIDAAKEELSKNELAVIQSHTTKLLGSGKSTVTTHTMLVHSSGEWFKTSLEVPIAQMKGLSPAQMIGVVMTYSRRYAYQSLIGIATNEDTDASIKTGEIKY